jgi:hypothetical protein
MALRASCDRAGAASVCQRTDGCGGCQYRASQTTRSSNETPDTPIELCRSATEELKNRRFGGEFMRMLEWWRINKVVEHQKLEAANAELAGFRKLP